MVVDNKGISVLVPIPPPRGALWLTPVVSIALAGITAEAGIVMLIYLDYALEETYSDFRRVSSAFCSAILRSNISSAFCFASMS